jgi:hypothetical protein
MWSSCIQRKWYNFPGCVVVLSNRNLLATQNLLDVPVTGSQPGNTGYMLASFRKLNIFTLGKTSLTAFR